MTMFARSSLKAGTALLLVTMLGAASGCGVAYTPQEFEESSFTYGYKGSFDGLIEVVPMTFTSVRTANADGFVPRSLPPMFSEADPLDTLSVRDRIAQAGLDRVSPALVFNLPPPPSPYDSAREILPPGLREEGRGPIPVPDPIFRTAPDYTMPDGLLSSTNIGSVAPTPATVSEFLPDPAPAIPEIEPFRSDVDLSTRLERPQLRRRAANNPIPDIQPDPYRIGPGDVIGLNIQSRSTGRQNATAEDTPQFQVQDNGEIFLSEVGAINVEGLTLREARQIINERVVGNNLGFGTGVQIVEFGSKSIAVSGLGGSRRIPLTVRPTTLGDAVVEVGGLGPNPANTIVRVLRDGKIFEMSGDQILGSDQFANRILVDGDVLSVVEGYDPASALAYFDQQLTLRSLEQARYQEELERVKEARAAAREARLEARLEARTARTEAREARAEARQTARETRDDARQALQDARSDEALKRELIRFEIERENYRLEAERLRQEAQVARLEAQRESDQVNEEARIANIEARQVYLNRLRELERLNRTAMVEVRNEARGILLANQAEQLRERTDRRALLELELQEERLRLEQVAGRRAQERELFTQRANLGAVERDYVTVAGETRQQAVVPMPFSGRMTLNRVLYQETGGIDPISGDTSEIYVIRTPLQTQIDSRLIAYHLDASNPAALAVASQFEMRPNDVVYVNPQPITKWNRLLTQLLPSTGLLQSTAGGLVN